MLRTRVIHDTTRLNFYGADAAQTEHHTDSQEQTMMTGHTTVHTPRPDALHVLARYTIAAVLLGVGAIPALTQAQLVPSVTANAPSSAASGPSGLERAQRQVDNVYKWIKLADKPRPAPTPPPTSPPAPAPRPAATKPAAALAAVAPAVASSPAPAEVIAPPMVATPEPQPAPAVAPVMAPPPVQVAKAPEPVIEEETPLRILSQEQPTVPRELRNDLENARVMMAFLVGIDGKVTNARAISSTNRKLERPTITAVSTWLFAPIKTPREVQVEIEFNVK